MKFAYSLDIIEMFEVEPKDNDVSKKGSKVSHQTEYGQTFESS